jgi:hypothetical protein
VDVHADEGERLVRQPVAIDGRRLLQGDAELVGAEPGRDVRVAAGVDVGIDPQRHAGAPSEGPRGRRDAIELAG